MVLQESLRCPKNANAWATIKTTKAPPLILSGLWCASVWHAISHKSVLRQSEICPRIKPQVGIEAVRPSVQIQTLTHPAQKSVIVKSVLVKTFSVLAFFAQEMITT